MKVKNLWLWLVLLATNTLSAQTTMVIFDYDADGNRTGRWLEVELLKSSDTLTIDPSLYSYLAELSDEQQDVAGYRATQLYPNPLEQHLNVMPGNMAESVCRYRLLDSNGRLLREDQASQYPFTIDLQQLQSGIYYLHLHSGKLNQMFKLIKK